jgi:Mrp family chromosome partitioning ATPase
MIGMPGRHGRPGSRRAAAHGKREGLALIERFEMHPSSRVKHVIGVMSGKGGVGKSSITALTAVALARRGYRVGVLDADVTGPSMPKMFGVTTTDRVEPAPAGDDAAGGIVPGLSRRLGIKVVSLNLLLDDENLPVIWRGPMLMGMIKEFWTQSNWGELDYIVIDLPPGTSDIPLSVMQSVPLDGLITVTSPQRVAAMVVKKAVNMARMMEKPVIGLVENMSYAQCPDCGRRIELFGPSTGEAQAAELGLPYIGAMPIDPRLATLADAGEIEEYEHPTMNALAEAVEKATA